MRFKPSPAEAHQRLDHFIIKKGAPLSRSRLQKLIRDGFVTVKGERAKASYKVQSRDEILVKIPPPTPPEVRAEKIPIDIVYENSSLLVVNKPAGMVVHPGAGVYSGTLVNALLYYCKDLSGIGGIERPGIVHRLDKETSGLLVVAKNDRSHIDLSHQFKRHSIKRTYIALVFGRLKEKEGKVELPIGRDIRERKKISPRTRKPRSAITRYRVIEVFDDASLLEVKPATGRTHQIRVHMSFVGHPLLGDKVYGGKRVSSLRGLKIGRQMLHALRLGFLHPESKEYMEFEAPIPEDMKDLINRFRREVCP